MPASKIQILAIPSQERGALFEVATSGSKCLIAVMDPRKRDVAVLTSKERIANGLSLCRILGTVAGGTLAVGCIAVGSRFYMRDEASISEPVLIPPVTGIRRVPWPKQAEHIIAKAARNFAEAIDATVAREFPSDNRERVREILGRFGNAAGKSAALATLVLARRNGKLREAMALAEQYWFRVWKCELPEIAGDPGVSANRACWQMFYEALGVPSPM